MIRITVSMVKIEAILSRFGAKSNNIVCGTLVLRVEHFWMKNGDY